MRDESLSQRPEMELLRENQAWTPQSLKAKSAVAQSSAETRGPGSVAVGDEQVRAERTKEVEHSH